MNALILTLFVSLMLAFMGVLFFAFSHTQGTHHQADRLSLLPLEDDLTHNLERDGTGAPIQEED